MEAMAKLSIRRRLLTTASACPWAANASAPEPRRLFRDKQLPYDSINAVVLDLRH